MRENTKAVCFSIFPFDISIIALSTFLDISDILKDCTEAIRKI
jgi:hypothetical protein